jgi:hypothetical protein
MKTTKAKIKIKYNKVQQELKSTILWFVMLKLMPVELQKSNKIFCRLFWRWRRGSDNWQSGWLGFF